MLLFDEMYCKVILVFVVVYDIDNDQTVIGTLNVSVECVAAMQAVKEELPTM